MGFKNVLVRELDGTEEIKLRIDKKIIRPKFKFEDEIEDAVWEMGMEEAILPFLKEEMRKARKGQRRKDVKYLYSCPYCNFKSEFFHCVDLHTFYTEKCYKRSLTNPCLNKNYRITQVELRNPINLCIHKPTGKQFIP